LVEIRPLQAKEISQGIVGAINELLSQLVSTPRVVSQEELANIVRQQGTRLYLAYEKSGVVGMLTAVVYHCPTRTSMMIEDVVVDEEFRRLGIAKRLTMTALDWARSHDVATIDLTSNPTRTAAHELYRSLGFELRETGCYRLDLWKP